MSENIWAKLAAPLDPRVIKTRQQAGRQVAYIDSRTVTDILDTVVPGEWHIELDVLPTIRDSADGEPYVLKARLRILDVTREDVGQGADYKAAASDALKRAAVRFGIGRELYGAKIEAQTATPGGLPVHTAPTLTSAASPRVLLADEPSCPICGGKMWDDRANKKNPKAPDFRCRNKPKVKGGPGCEGVIWPPKPSKGANVGTPATPKESVEEFVERFAEDADSLPF